MLKFGQREVPTKDFYRQRQITDVFTIDINKLVISDKVPCNNGKDCRYIVRYQADEVTLPLFIKTPKNIFSYGVSQYDKNSAYTISYNVSEEKEWASRYKIIWNEVESQLFEKMATEPIKGESRYVNGKLKTWKECTKTNFHGQDVSYDIIDQKTYDQKLMEDRMRKLVWGGLQKNIVMDGGTMIDKRTGEVLDPEVDSSYWKDKF